MKVLKKGVLGDLKRWSAEVTCPRKSGVNSLTGCGATLLVRQKDLRLACDPGPCSRHYYPAVRCTECGAIVKVEDVPRPIWIELTEDQALLDPMIESDF